MTIRCRHHAVALVAASALLAAGCSVRDERAVGSGTSAWWSTATGEPRPGLVAAPSGSPTSAPTIEYVDGFTAGERQAAEARLPMLIVFGASWCRWTGDLMAAVSGDPHLVSLARRTVCVSVDADRDPSACERFSVRAFPTVVLLDAAGSERFRATGSSAIGLLPTALAEVLGRPVASPRVADGDARTRR